LKDRKKLLIFFAIGFIILGGLMAYIFRPLINTMLLGFVFAFLFYPIYNKVNKKIRKPRISAMLVCILFILIITIPLLFALNSIAGEIYGISKNLEGVSLYKISEDFECDSKLLCKFPQALLNNNVIQVTVKDFLSMASQRTKIYIGQTLIMIPAFVLQAFIILFMMYYLFIDGHKFIDKVRKATPIAERHKDVIINNINRVLGGVLFGSIVVGAIQGMFGAFGFFVFGIRAPLLWGIMMFLFSFIPMLGTGIVWFPASAYMIINAIIASDEGMLFRGIGLMVYCIIFVSTVDNFIRPKLVSDKTKIHPVLVLFGVIGGIVVFNAAGVIIGPIVVGMFLSFIDMFDDEKDYLLGHKPLNADIKKKEKQIINAQLQETKDAKQ
jgi:predicted PurR-regulated permease PerM